jgi:tyrosyl-tRNA synthetase
MVQQGGIYVNDQRVDAVETTLTPAYLTPEGILLRAGKKKYHRLVVEE